MNSALLVEKVGEEHEESLGEYIIHHLQDSHEWNLFGYHIQLPTFTPVQIFGISVDFSITLHVLMMWFASLFLILMFWLTFREKEGKRTPLKVALESVYLFIRDEISIPNLGPNHGVSMSPFLATIFLFILTCNLMGLIPLFSTATGNIGVTASLAIITFFMIQGMGIKKRGLLGYLRTLVPHGVPIFLYPILIPIEILGLFTKPFALAMRLFANMLAGHTVIYALLGLIIVLGSLFISPVSIIFALFINLLELLVALLQAYIFTMLSAVFIGMAVIGEH